MKDEALKAAIQDAFWAKSEQLLFEHTNPWELDEALLNWGFSLGPCEAQDLLGLDVVLQRQNTQITPVLARMVAEGRLGKKGSVGFYRYPSRSGAVIDPLIEDLIREEAWFAKMQREELDDAQLIGKLLWALRDIAAALHEKGVSRWEIEKAFMQAVHFPAEKVFELWRET